MRSLFVLLLVPSVAQAQALVAAVLDAPGVSEASVRRVQRATESVLKQLSGLPVGEAPTFKRGAPKRCDDCAEALVKSLGAATVVLVDLKAAEPRGERVAIDFQLWVDGERVAARHAEGTTEAFELAARPALEALLLGWMRKGFGGLRVDVEPGALVKLDGRLAQGKPSDTQALTAGVHLVDVVFSDGRAVLQRFEVAEGQRGQLEVLNQSAAFDTKGSIVKSTGTLRAVSYGTWMVGAAALAGGLVAGALGRGTAAGLTPCTAQTRDCATLDTVLERNRQAQAYASTGNVLLGVGGGLLAVGAGLFVIDVVMN